jgi:hypothetical protein
MANFYNLSTFKQLKDRILCKNQSLMQFRMFHDKSV